MKITCKTPAREQSCSFDIKPGGFACGDPFDTDRKYIPLPAMTSMKKLKNGYGGMTENEICKMMGKFHSILKRKPYDMEWTGGKSVPFP